MSHIPLGEERRQAKKADWNELVLAAAIAILLFAICAGTNWDKVFGV